MNRRDASVGGRCAPGCCHGEPIWTGSRVDAGRPKRLPGWAVELLRLLPDVNLAGGGLPTRLEREIHLKTNTTPGLTIPQSQRLRTDEVIQ